MKEQKKKKSGISMKISVCCFVIFVLIGIGHFIVNLAAQKVGDIYFYALLITFVIQMLAGIISVISFIISCIKQKAISFGFTVIIIAILACVIGEGYLGLPYIKDFQNGAVTVTTSNYSVIGKENNKSIYFADDNNNEEALKLNSETLEFLENNNAVDVDNSYVYNTSYLHHIISVNIEYYPNTGILKEISVPE